jgi:hypothetical protein
VSATLGLHSTLHLFGSGVAVGVVVGVDVGVGVGLEVEQTQSVSSAQEGFTHLLFEQDKPESQSPSLVQELWQLVDFDETVNDV